MAANSELRRAVEALEVPTWVPPMDLCTDNAAMIAAAARFSSRCPTPATSRSTPPRGWAEPMARVTLYGKPGCHLCEDARAALLRLRDGREFDLEEVDVSVDPALHRRYGERIPVVMVDGEELFEHFVDAVVLAESLDRVDA